jgi:isopenicillin N synthase-like dioxygenase
MEFEKLDTSIIGSTDTKEGYYIGREVPGDSEEAKKPMRGPNLWPEESLLPNWRKDMTEYFE